MEYINKGTKKEMYPAADLHKQDIISIRLNVEERKQLDHYMTEYDMTASKLLKYAAFICLQALDHEALSHGN
jgi:hypothetical protein